MNIFEVYAMKHLQRFAFLTLFTSVLWSQTAAADTLVHETIIDAPIADVWNAFTEADEISTWMVPKADIDLRVGGLMRTTYNPEAALDGPEAIHHRILAFEPEKMIAYQVIKCPEGFEYAELIKQSWNVVSFESLGPNRTKIRGAGCGYKTGGAWDQMRAYFDEGNAWTYEQLRKKFAAHNNDDKPTDAQTVVRLLSRLVDGEWIHESESPDGGVFRVRNVLQHGPDGQSIVGQGWLGNADGMHPHGSTQVYLDPLSQQVRFFNINEHGAIAEGAITLVDEQTVEWDWRTRGTKEAYSVLMKFTGSDTYEFTLRLRTENDELQQLVQISYDRVEKAPKRFLVKEEGT